MVLITNDVFNGEFDRISKIIHDAKFVAFDFEFSGIQMNRSLFDTMEERYSKYRKLVNNIIPLQIGLTCFEFVWDDDSYKVTTFTFPLFKKPILSIDRSFLLHAAAVVFLTENNFDFNKSFYDGIPYLNRIERKLIADKLKSKNFFYDVLNTIHTQLIIEFNENKATIDDWYSRANIGDELHVSIPQSRFKYYQPQVTFLFKTHITSDPTRFLKVYPEDNQKIKVKKVTEDQLKAYGDSLNDKDGYLDKHGGFQTVVEMLISSKKPLIGHNCMIDFMILYNEFIEPLPQSVQEFKRKLHDFFPVIFDTKFITYETKSSFGWDNNSLDSMFEYFNSQPDDVISKYSKPVVLRSDAEGGVDEQFHEAGYDSYCTGCVFLKIAHFLTNEKLTEFTSRSITCFEHLKSIDHMMNNVHLMQCSIPYMKIDGEDPKSQRPKQLYASIKNPSIDFSTLYKHLKQYGVIEIKPLTSTDYWTAVIAVGNRTSANNILHDFKHKKDFKIEEYCIFKHSTLLKRSILCGILTGSLLAFLAFNYIKKKN